MSSTRRYPYPHQGRCIGDSKGRVGVLKSQKEKPEKESMKLNCKNYFLMFLLSQPDLD